ncbi:MAG: hypothetical protein KF746_04300 [Chitinophagaceae bacterium]|nr:hypothetical protein [Chitinophagaceae bacterium]
MGLAYPMQKFQDWFTQQWVIIWGRKIDPKDFPWLMGPFGNLNGIGEGFIHQLAEKENLIIERDVTSQGLIASMDILNLSETERSNLSQHVIKFYENTANYNLGFTVKWNPFFKLFGSLVTKLFSNRINQLNIPTKDIKNEEPVKSEIIRLSDPLSHKVKYTIWFRTSCLTGKVIYSGIYGICKLPSGKTCIKAVFPLPKGNATVIMSPGVGANGELVLDSSGKKFGDAGFYFLLNDSKGSYWVQFVRSFRDRLTVSTEKDHISAEQVLTLWHQRVAKFSYRMEIKKQTASH